MNLVLCPNNNDRNVFMSSSLVDNDRHALLEQIRGYDQDK